MSPAALFLTWIVLSALIYRAMRAIPWDGGWTLEFQDVADRRLACAGAALISLAIVTVIGAFTT